MPTLVRLIPIYTTRGDAAAFLDYPYLYNPQGEWIGWVTTDRDVYSVHGHYVGWMTGEPRILRKRGYDFVRPKRQPPPAPPRVQLPAQVPLAPQMAELSLSTIDVLDEMPELLPPTDFGELREDMD